MQPSVYQQAIIDWLQLEDGNAIISARAGSGKTSTLVMLADVVQAEHSRAVFLAFNKSIQQELEKRLPRHVEAKTFHALCRASLARNIPESRNRDWVQLNKVHGIIDEMIETDARIEEVRLGVAKLVGLMKANMLLPDAPASDIVNLITQHEIDFDVDESWISSSDILAFTRECLRRNNEQTRFIDFDDMLYLTAIRGCVLTKYTHVFVDECQDLNKVQRYLLSKLLSRNGRLIAVGDESQAIYGFRGADANSMNELRDAFNCRIFPLSISYRCAASIVKLAQTIEPDIQPRENAPEGTVSTLDKFSVDDFQPEDMVVCRNVAPVVSLAFRFIRAHKPVKMLGRDIGEGLISLIKKMRAATLEELDERIQRWADRETDKALAKRLEAKAQRIMDQCDTIVAMCEGMPENERTVADLVRRINDLFSDKADTPRTTLATVHKSKGMEAHRVFILDPHLMPSRYAKLDWQMVQESNLRYVAITRALHTLHFLDSKNIA